jgi:hypothetical protein
MPTISPWWYIEWTWWVDANATSLQFTWYVWIFRTEQELLDIVVLETTISFIILFTLIFSKILIRKTLKNKNLW